MEKNILKFILLIGIISRVYFQFITPCFNGDEISLGNNFKTRDFISLLLPLDSSQSAPPLYLVFQKFTISIPLVPFWIKAKLLSFLISTLIIIQVYHIAKYKFRGLFPKIIFLSLFCFNPFLLYNTLTIKQYGFDLLFVLVTYDNFQKHNSSKIIYFIVGSLTSNIAMFFNVGLLLIIFFQNLNKNKTVLSAILKFFNFKNLCLMIGPLIYCLYFMWFMQQEGASELKIYMQEYWKNSFIPLNQNIFQYSLYFMNGLISFFISSFLILGLLLFSMSILGFYLKYKSIKLSISSQYLLIGLFVHVILNVFHLYPLSDRLYIYLSLPLYLIFVNGLEYLIESTKHKHNKFLIISLISTLIIGYMTYLPYRENDIIHLNEYLKSKYTNKISFSQRSMADIDRFNKFTENAFKVNFYNLDNDIKTSTLFISRVHHKIGHQEKTAAEEPTTQLLLRQGKLNLIHKVDGYNIYELN